MWGALAGNQGSAAGRPALDAACGVLGNELGQGYTFLRLLLSSLLAVFFISCCMDFARWHKPRHVLCFVGSEAGETREDSGSTRLPGFLPPLSPLVCNLEQVPETCSLICDMT